MVNAGAITHMRGVRDRGEEDAPLAISATRSGWLAVAALARQADGLKRIAVQPGEAPVWPDGGELGALAAGGLGAIAIGGVLCIGRAAAEQSLAFIRFLRDCESWGVQVAWQGSLGDGVAPNLLSHLAPPAPLLAEAAEGTATAPGDRYGRCYWRAGPGFAVVSDTRPGRPAQRLTFSEGPELHLFHTLQRPVEHARCARTGAARRALADLVQEGVVLQLGAWALSLPCRMRLWPVPNMAI